MQNKKESLLNMIIKTLLAVIIFAGVGTIIIGGGYLIGKQNKIPEPIKKDAIVDNNEMKNKVVVEDEEIDISKFIPEHSILVQKKMEDIDGDNTGEIFLYYISDLEKDLSNFNENKTENTILGRIHLKILKSEKNGNYERAWSYAYPELFVYDKSEEKNDSHILIYDKETEIPKIGFVTNYKNNPSLNSYVFVYFDKKKSIDFDTIRIFHKGFDASISSDRFILANPINDVKIKDIDGDGICEIIKIISSKKQEYKWNKENYSYKYQSEESLLDYPEKIYRSEKFGYEFKYPSYINPSDIDIFEKDEKLIISYGHGLAIIYAPKKVKLEEIEKYRCIEGEEKSACSKIQSENEFDIFKFTYGAVSHWDSSSRTYSLIRENEDKSFLVIEIGTQGINVDETAASLKMIQNKTSM